jgi:hypothetical protein
VKRYLYIEEGGATKASAIALGDISDVTIADVATGEVLTKTAVDWENEPAPTNLIDGGYFA